MEKLTDSGYALDKTNAKFGSMMWVLNQILNVVCLTFCSVMALLGYIKVGHIVLYQTLFTQISGYIYTLINILPQVGSGFDALNSISEIMSVKDVEVTIGKAKIPKVDGKSITDFKLSEYRHHISVVPQNSILFSGSIKENITYGLSHYTKKQLNDLNSKTADQALA